MLDPIDYSAETRRLIDMGIIYDMDEGKAPYSVRYCLPDYRKYMKQGSGYLDLKPPETMWQAVGNLINMYHHVPSSGNFPVYIGCLDELLDPFIGDENEAETAIRFLLEHVDRSIADSFCQANLGSKDSRAGRIILKLTSEMQRPVPNMTLLYSAATPDDYAKLAVETGLRASKPCFANDDLYRKDMGDYAVASCYNVLPVGGAGLTLMRLNIHNLPKIADSVDQLLNSAVPGAVAAVCEMIDKRSRFIIEESRFFENSFLYHEGLIHNDKDHLVGMFGYAGLAECVNTILGLKKPDKRFGRNPDADALGEAVMEKIFGEMRKHEPKYGRYELHAQVGVREDTESSPGGRIPVGEEPDMPFHIRHFAAMHRRCYAGCGEHFTFDATARNNIDAVLDIIKGAFQIGARYLSCYTNNTDLVRVTGYLVKRSDIEKYRRGENVLNNVTRTGSMVDENLQLFSRREHSIAAYEEA
jgi:YjjI family glycine radical enzyme